MVPFEKLATLFSNCDGVVGELLGVVHQFLVGRAVQIARGLQQQPGGVILARDPWTAIDHDDLVAAVLDHNPGTDDRLENRRSLAGLFVLEIDFYIGRPGCRGQKNRGKENGSASYDCLHLNLLRTSMPLARNKHGQRT